MKINFYIENYTFYFYFNSKYIMELEDTNYAICMCGIYFFGNINIP